MAISSSTIWEVESGGSDTLNGGAFDPGQTAGMFTDGAATVANTSAPVFTSASYNFVAGDVGAWVYIASGSNWIAGWYKITSVGANAATLNATSGQAVLKVQVPSTATGCATTASPTGATWSIDYSQQTAAQFSYTDLISAGTGLTVSSVAHPFNSQQVGNCLVITSGTNFNPGRYVIVSVSANVATVVGPTNITTGAGAAGNGGLGGALATPAKNLAILVAGNETYWKAATYTTGAAINLSVAGSSALPVSFIGYSTVRGDNGQATIQVTANSFVALAPAVSFQRVVNVIVDMNGHTAGAGINVTGGQCILSNVKVLGGATLYGITLGANTAVVKNSWVTGCTSAATAGIRVNGNGCVVIGTRITGNACPGILDNVAANVNAAGIYIRNIIDNNTGATSDGLQKTTAYMLFVHGNVFYKNGRDGIRLTAATSVDSISIQNNIIYGNSGAGINSTTTDWSANPSFAMDLDYNAIGGNTPDRTFLPTGAHDILLTADPFTSGGSNDFSLNSIAGGGASCKSAGFPGVLQSGGTGFLDIGPLQHRPAGLVSVKYRELPIEEAGDLPLRARPFVYAPVSGGVTTVYVFARRMVFDEAGEDVMRVIRPMVVMRQADKVFIKRLMMPDDAEIEQRPRTAAVIFAPVTNVTTTTFIGKRIPAEMEPEASVNVMRPSVIYAPVTTIIASTFIGQRRMQFADEEEQIWQGRRGSAVFVSSTTLISNVVLVKRSTIESEDSDSSWMRVRPSVIYAPTFTIINTVLVRRQLQWYDDANVTKIRRAFVYAPFLGPAATPIINRTINQYLYEEN